MPEGVFTPPTKHLYKFHLECGCVQRIALPESDHYDGLPGVFCTEHKWWAGVEKVEV